MLTVVLFAVDLIFIHILGCKIVKFGSIRDFFFKGTIGLFPDAGQGLVSAILYLLVIWAFLYFLYRKKIFLKV